ncbi:MAG: VUT family protein [Rhodospirillales bacterium]|nr:VUT family protein [Rhodospirillales bacterium]
MIALAQRLPQPRLPDPRLVGALAFLLFLGSIPLAGWMITHVGTSCIPHGPCVLPVAPGIEAPSGVLLVGVAIVLRDVVQRCLGKRWSLIAIAIGCVATLMVALPSLVLASGSAFLLSELADFGVYTPLQRHHLLLAVVASSCVGLVVDSLVFLSLAFGSLEFLAGQIIGKLWAVLIAVPLVGWLRRVAPTPA